MLGARPAQANGRFPYAQQLVEAPGNPARLWLRTTYGIVTSSDSGKSWHWICEDAVGYTGSEDPALGVMGDGTVIAGVFKGLAISQDQGCGWSFIDGGSDAGLDNRFVSDVAVDRNDANKAIALVSISDFSGTYLNQIWQTGDNAATWTELGPDLDNTAVGLTLDSAPSDAQRIYVSAAFNDGSTTQGGLLRTEDGAQTWKRLDIAGSTLQNPPFIGAVDPTNADALYVRLNGDSDDSLLYSSDAGGTWKELIKKQAELFGFALSPDGQTVLAGFGKPDQNRPYDTAAVGIWAAHPPAFTFQKIFDGPISCLAWTDQGVYACASQFVQGFEVGLSKDEGKSFTTLLQLAGVEGPLDCPAGTSVGDTCGDKWPAVCTTIGRCDADGGVAGSAGSSGGAGSGGSSAASGGASNGSSGGSSCGCRLPANGSAAGGALALVAALGAMLARRRRKR